METQSLQLSERLSPRRRFLADLLFNWIHQHGGKAHLNRLALAWFAEHRSMGKAAVNQAVDDLFCIGAIDAELMPDMSQRLSLPDAENLPLDVQRRRYFANKETRDLDAEQQIYFEVERAMYSLDGEKPSNASETETAI